MARFPTLPGGPPRFWWIALWCGGMDASGRYTGNTPSGPVRGKRFTLQGVSIVITNGRRITGATDHYDMTERYRQVASVP